MSRFSRPQDTPVLPWPSYRIAERRIVQYLYPLRNRQGDDFAAGSIFRVLRDNADGTVNLTEVDLADFYAIGRTIAHVPVR